MFKLNIETSNDAFTNPNTGNPDPIYETMEVSRILKTIANKMSQNEREGQILDFNGNNVGKWEFYDEEK